MLNSWYKLQVPVYYVPISISFVLYPATTFILTFTGFFSYKFFTNRLNYNNDDNNSDNEKDNDDTLDEKLETFSDEETSDQEPNHDNDINQKPIHYIDNNHSEILSCEESEESEYDGHTEIVLEKSVEIEKQISFESSNDSDLEVHAYDRHCIIF